MRYLITFLLYIILTLPQLVNAQEELVLECPQVLNPQITENFNESAALLIGNSRFVEDWNPLPTISEDIDGLEKILCERGFEVIKHKDLTSRQIDSVILNFITVYGKEPNNRLLFYLAGHGMSIKKATGLYMDYFAGWNAPRPSVDKNQFEKKSLELERFKSYAKRIDANHAMFIFDACFAGNIFTHTAQNDPALLGAAMYSSVPIRFFITSGDVGQEVSPQSYFANKIIEALSSTIADFNGDYILTDRELGLFLDTQISKYSSFTQTPKYGALREDKLDDGKFIFGLGMYKLSEMEAKEHTKKSIEIEIARLKELLKNYEQNSSEEGISSNVDFKSLIDSLNMFKLKYEESIDNFTLEKSQEKLNIIINKRDSIGALAALANLVDWNKDKIIKNSTSIDNSQKIFIGEKLNLPDATWIFR